MPDRATEEAVAQAVSLEAARAAAGPHQGPGSADPLVGDLRRAGLLTLLVLHFVAQEPSYGNRLMDRVLEVSGGVLNVNPNTMYPLLRSLQERGLLTGAWEHPERRSRRFYAITAEGEAERRRLAAEIGPRLTAVARGISRIEAEVLHPPAAGS